MHACSRSAAPGAAVLGDDLQRSPRAFSWGARMLACYDDRTSAGKATIASHRPEILG